MNDLRVVDIFPSYEGEGPLVGTPTIFLRLAGCSIGCDFCDTPEAQSFNSGLVMDKKEVISEIKKICDNTGIQRLSITGGNPMESPLSIISYIIANLPMYINIEHPGVFKSLFNEVNFLTSLTSMDSITFDIKPPTAKVDFDSYKFNFALFKTYNSGVKCFIKAVFENEEDIYFIVKTLGLPFLTSNPKIELTLQPCAGKQVNIKSEYLLRALSNNNGRLVPQIHKFLEFK